MRQCPDRSGAFLDEATRATILIVALQRTAMMITRHAAGDRPLPRVTGHRVASGSTCSPLGNQPSRGTIRRTGLLLTPLMPVIISTRAARPPQPSWRMRAPGVSEPLGSVLQGVGSACRADGSPA